MREALRHISNRKSAGWDVIPDITSEGWRRGGSGKSHVGFTYLDLGPPVPLGASGDEKPPSITVTGDPAGSMPADTHLF